MLRLFIYALAKSPLEDVCYILLLVFWSITSLVFLFLRLQDLVVVHLINEGPTPHNCLSTISSPHLLFPLPTSSASKMASLEIMAGPPALSTSSAGIRKLVCRVCQKGFTKAEHLRVSFHVPTNLRGRYTLYLCQDSKAIIRGSTS